jgi:hypothetical protein
MTTWLSLCSAAAISGLLSIAILGTSQNAMGGPNTEIVSQGTQSSTGDIYSQGMMVQNGPWAGEIYSQGMKMATGEVYSQGTEITMSWEVPDTLPLGQGCAGIAFNCTNNITNTPASNVPDNQPPTNLPPVFDTFVETGNDPIAGPTNSGLFSPASAPLTDAFLAGGNDPPSGSASSGSLSLGSLPPTDAFLTAGSDPPSGPATSGRLGPDVPPSTGISASTAADPVPEPNGLMLIGPALILFGCLLSRRERGLNG